MRRVYISRKGGPEVLQVRDEPDPAPGAGELRVAVKFAGINWADVMARLGIYPDAPPIPCVVGYEVSGIVDRVGPGVDDAWIGRRVVGVPRFGGYASHVVLPLHAAAPLPDTITFEAAAAMPVNYLTAHHMLFHIGTVHPGARVLIHSAAGGVGIAAIQLLKPLGARVWGTASPAKHAFLQELGVTPLDSRKPLEAALDAVDPKARFDVILDPVGGDSWRAGVRRLDDCGRLVMFGLSAAAGTGPLTSVGRALIEMLRLPRFSPLVLMDRNTTVSGCNMGHLFHRTDILMPQLHKLMGYLADGTAAPHIDSVFPFERAAEAHARLQSRAAVGKVLLSA